MVEKTCPKCGTVCYDGDFCMECGTKLNVETNGFFNRADSKISLSTLIFSFIIVGIFLFIGALFWSIFASSGVIGFPTHVLLTVIFAVFLGGIFVGYFNCYDNTYIVPNFIAYFGAIASAILCGVGGIFTVLIGFSSSLSSVFSQSSTASLPGADPYSSAGMGNTDMTSTILNNFIIDIFILVRLIPFASYLGIYVGYLIKNNL